MSRLDPSEPRIVPRSEHPISRSQIDKNALKVLYRLHQGGYLAYLVGGSVRDLLLGRQPKDFDIATGARPPEIRRLFRNARIIGRRFRLAHILFREGVIEVSTFRRVPQAAEQEGATADDLLITSDNTFGTPREDAFRRDFTVNALFYNIADFTVIDFVGGIEDLDQRLIRVIGDPDVRFREDPVRMLRACELAGRLGFGIEERSQEAIANLRRDLEKASPARVSEELVELMRCGRAGAAMQWMLDLGILEVLLPEAYAMVRAGQRGLGEFGRILPTLDRMVVSGRAPSDTALLAALLLPSVLLRRYDIEAVAGKAMTRPALDQMVSEVATPFFARFAFSKLRVQQILDALTGFLRLCEPHRAAAERVRLTGKPYFADALALFEILTEATGEGYEVLAQWQAAAKRRPVLALEGREERAESEEITVAAPRRRARRRRRR